MDITYLGAGSVKLSGKGLTIVVDPYTDDMGLGKFNTKADVVLYTTMEGAGQAQAEMSIDSPGEYEVKGAMIMGVPARLHIDEDGSRATVYSVLIDGVNVVVTGGIAGKIDNKYVDTLGNVDVLVVPVGGHGLTLEPEEAATVVSQLEPGYVVPVHYADDKTHYAVPQADLSEFLKEMGSTPEPVAKLKIAAKEAPAETQVAVLIRAGSQVAA